MIYCNRDLERIIYCLRDDDDDDDSGGKPPPPKRGNEFGSSIKMNSIITFCWYFNFRTRLMMFHHS